jgi:VWFA-related protein
MSRDIRCIALVITALLFAGGHAQEVLSDNSFSRAHSTSEKTELMETSTMSRRSYRQTLFSSPLFWACFTIAATLMAVSPLRGQNPEPASTFKIQTTLVQLDVTVLDRNGASVPNLGKEDFTVFENGVQQTIRDFEPANQHYLSEAATGQGINSTADLQRLAPDTPVTILVLDEFNTAFRDAAFARIQIRNFLLGQPETLKEPTSFLVTTDDGFQEVHDFTLSRPALLDALKALKPAYPATLMRSGGSPEGRAIRFAQTLASLQQITQATAGHKGRKNIIWVGRGFDSIDLRDEPDHQVQLVRGAAERAVNLMRDAHVVLYTIDPTISTSVAAEPQVGQTQTDAAAFLAETHNRANPFDGTVSFNTLAPETGGRAFALNNDLDQEITTSVSEGTAYYSLSYTPVGEFDSKDPYRRITVLVNRPDVTVVTRHGYFVDTPRAPQRTASQTLRSNSYELSAALTSNMPYTGLGLLASRSQVDPTLYLVQVVTTDLDWVTAEGGSVSAHMIIAAIGFDAKGRIISKDAKDATAAVRVGVSPTAIPFANLRITLPDNPKVRRVRIAVRDQSTGKLGTADIRLPAQ